MAFRFNAINGALTYPQVGDTTKEDLYAFLINLCYGSGPSLCKVDRVLVGEEKHWDGGRHFHAYVRFDKKPNIRTVGFFDFENNHPNIQSCRSVKDWLKYCIKDDTAPLSNFDYTNAPTKMGMAILAINNGINDPNKSLNDLVDAALTEEPNLLKCTFSVENYIMKRRRLSTRLAPERPIGDFNLDDNALAALMEWKMRMEVIVRGDRRTIKSLWFVGETGWGKTSLARSLGFHWYMQNLWSVDNYSDEDHTYGVLDDIPWDMLKYNYKAVLGRQKDVTFTDKYRSKSTKKGGYPVIVCSNTLPDFTEDERCWLKGNIDFVKLSGPLFECVKECSFELIKL